MIKGSIERVNGAGLQAQRTPGTAIHFGAGALRRGLVVPRLVDAGWSVTIVDSLADLTDALGAKGGYRIEIADESGISERQVSVAETLQPDRDRAVLLDRLAGVKLVTTAVRRGNLPGVARTLATAWEKRLPKHVTLLGCENVERVDKVLAGYLTSAGMSADQIQSVNIPRTVVDRICAADWPRSLTIRTESYSELAAAKHFEPIPGVQQVANIDAIFDRKRYLVNTIADAAAILGCSKRYLWLSEAFADSKLVSELAPLAKALALHLVLRHGFSLEELKDYAACSRSRLANPLIPRRLDTVARDVWRKLQPTERFFAPLIDLYHRGEPIEPAIALLGRLARLGAVIDGSPQRPAFRPDQLREVAVTQTTESMPWSKEMLQHIYGYAADCMESEQRA